MQNNLIVIIFRLRHAVDVQGCLIVKFLLVTGTKNNLKMLNRQLSSGYYLILLNLVQILFVLFSYL